jgi:hypothetical protein
MCQTHIAKYYIENAAKIRIYFWLCVLFAISFCENSKKKLLFGKSSFLKQINCYVYRHPTKVIIYSSLLIHALKAFLCTLHSNDLLNDFLTTYL